MKYTFVFIIFILFFSCKNEKKSSQSLISNEVQLSEDFIVIDQNYKQALKIASKKDKLIFIDFYTTWCAPCKKLDKLIFQNDSIKNILKRDFILLKYNAENDTIFHLSKKHHISSYPTGLILNNEGFVLNRKYGFAGSNFKTLSKSVLDFKNESIVLNNQNKVIKGYSNDIDATKYPKFYVDFVNRTNTKLNPADLNEYWVTHKNKFSEEYFSTLTYFGGQTSKEIAYTVLNNKEKYINLFGETDVKKLMFSIAFGRFDEAILEKNNEKFIEAEAYVKKALNKESAKNIIDSAKKDLLKSQNKWSELLDIYIELKKERKFSNGYANHFSWEVYLKCEDKEVIQHCLKWMKEVTDEEPQYDYLDTYALLLHKSGNIKDTKRVAQIAIKAGKKEGRKTTKLENLIKKL
ncbi:thioredoxin family protein [Polaribacter porphyrae]|uniref:Thioredoxin domain-containing protein n=1 Tax=Polaribacter porphyrae TaxID=1137780 RepID=A0A2S7WPX4_9FLAO|nr:thioredoxin family protein [Polaribacter porphyrae]PQJ79660.1 hypothetical protein BTO18_10965 [Polaribacter porphyrae]